MTPSHQHWQGIRNKGSGRDSRSIAPDGDRLQPLSIKVRPCPDVQDQVLSHWLVRSEEQALSARHVDDALLLLNAEAVASACVAVAESFS